MESNQKLFIVSNNKCTLDLPILNSQKITQSFDCLLVLNCEFNSVWLQKLLIKCKKIILVDGGANRFYKSKYKNSPKIMTLIGDFDSVQAQPLEYYTQINVQIKKDPCQDTTDFEKALNYARSVNFKTIVCFGGLGGRIDHTLATFNTITQQCNLDPELQILALDGTNFIYYLRGQVQYYIQKCQSMIDVGCGLIPFGKVSKMKTQGFQWNLGKEEGLESLEWGKFISTSNKMISKELQIKASDSLFFVAQIE